MIAKKPYGCLTVPGLATAILVILIVIGVGLAKGGTLFSPGALNAQSGAFLGGVSSHNNLSNDCKACHAFFWQPGASMAGRCVACHADIATQQQDATSLHGILFKDKPSMGCRACHPDHRGAAATLTDMSLADVSHDLFGFALNGAHASLACEKCHTNNTFSGFAAACSTCHADPAYHAGLFTGMTCDQCHTSTAWIPAAFTLSHPDRCGERNCLDHHRATCLDCHPVSLSASTCLKCHDSNNPGGDRGGGGG